MAKAADKATENKEPETPLQVPEAPSGFVRTTAVDDAPFFNMEEGNLCHGRVLGRYIMQQDPPSPYYQVELSRPCRVRKGTEREGNVEIMEVPKGAIVNLSETFRLQALRDKIAPEILAGAIYDLWVRVTGAKKKTQKGGRSFWPLDVQHQRVKVATDPIRPLAADGLNVQAAQSESGEEIPF